MQDFRRLDSSELLSFARIIANAYPGLRIASDEDIQKTVERMQKRAEIEPKVDYYGLFRDGQLVGGLSLYTYDMNLLGTCVKAGGIGNLAVDLLRKKEKAARDMMLSTLRLLQEQGMLISLLYSFRPDFYRKMGYGYGAKMNRYVVRPVDLPKGPSKEHVTYLTRDDIVGMQACYTRFFEQTHGMIAKPADDMIRMFDASTVRVVGCRRGNLISGYMVFSFRQDKDGRFLVNDLLIKELVYDAPDDLLELMTFLHAQADQIRKVIVDTQEEFFHFLPEDPRNGSEDLIPSVYHVTNTQGVGLMYRVLDVREVMRLLSSRDFGGQTCKVRLTIEDSFLPENGGSAVVHFDGGLPSVKADSDEWQFEVCLPIAEFTSLLMGAVDFRSLNRYGLGGISDTRYIDTLDRLFRAPGPHCLTAF